MKLFHCIKLSWLYCVVSLLVTFQGSAATVNVCDEASLRAALAAGGTVTFACDGTIVLTNTLVISQHTVLDGTGHSVVLSGGGLVRPFVVNGGVQFTMKAITVVDGLGITRGGGFLNGGTSRLVDCTFSNNVVVGAVIG